MVAPGCRCTAITVIAMIATKLVLAAALVCSSHYAVYLHCTSDNGRVVDTPRVCVQDGGTDFILPAGLPLPATCEVIAVSADSPTSASRPHSE